jgi:hypothetical protein
MVGMSAIEAQTTALLESLLLGPLLCLKVGACSALERSGLGFDPSQSPALVLNFQQKLGHLYEDCLSHLLQNSSDFELLAEHVQVFNQEQRTLGELDYILQHRLSATYIHLELAVKFYLATQQSGQWQYPGPDPRDNWDNKYARLNAHQLQLSTTPAAMAVLHQRFGIQSIRPHHLIYGAFFRPIDQPDAPLPANVSPNCRCGTWLYRTQWKQYFPELQQVRLIPKPLWPVVITPQNEALLPQIAVEALVAKASERAVMFHHPQEGTPCFLVPDQWSQ